MFGINRKKVGFCLMVLTSCFILAGLWAVLATPGTALAAKKPKLPPEPSATVDLKNGTFMTFFCSGISTTAGAFDGPLEDHGIRFYKARVPPFDEELKSCLADIDITVTTLDDPPVVHQFRSDSSPFMLVRKRDDGSWEVSLRISDTNGTRFQTDFVPVAVPVVFSTDGFTIHVPATDVVLHFQKTGERKKNPNGIGVITIGDLVYTLPQ